MTKILSLLSSTRTILAESSLLQLSAEGLCATILDTERKAKATDGKYFLQVPKVPPGRVRMRAAASRNEPALGLPAGRRSTSQCRFDTSAVPGATSPRACDGSCASFRPTRSVERGPATTR